MRRVLGWALLLAVVGAPAGAADRKPEGQHRGHRSFADVEHWAKVFDSRERDLWQKPIYVLDFLALQHGDVVADLGAGTGYFTHLLAVSVGAGGRVYAVDIEQAMLDYLMKRPGIDPAIVVPVLAEPDDPKLPDGELDVVLIVDTWHHIAQRKRYLGRIARALSPSGRVVIVDYREGELPVGPPPAEKLSREQVVREFREAGWSLATESAALPYQYLLTFYPPKPKASRGP